MFGLAVSASIQALAAPEPVLTGRPQALQLNMQQPVTGIGSYIYSLHNWMLIICLVIFVGVFGVMFYSVFKHRKSLGHKPATFHESTYVEIAWTIVPERSGRKDDPDVASERVSVAASAELAGFLNEAEKVVPRDGIEPPTLRFSVACSTN